MSADKLQNVRFTINEILSEPAASPATYFDDEPAPAPASNHPTKVQPPVEPAVVERPTDAGIAAISAKAAKSLFDRH